MISVEAATLIGRSPATQRRTRRGDRLMRRASADCHHGPQRKIPNGSTIGHSAAAPICGHHRGPQLVVIRSP